VSLAAQLLSALAEALRVARYEYVIHSYPKRYG
jgi:hypothetical protein